MASRVDRLRRYASLPRMSICGTRRNYEQGESVTALESSTKVQLGGTRGGPDEADPAPRPLVDPARHHRLDPHRLRDLLDLGGLSEQVLLRRRQRPPRPDQPLLLALHRRDVRARREVRLHLERLDALAGVAHLDLPPGLSTDLLLLPTQLLPRVLVVPAELRRRRRARLVLRARRASRCCMQNAHRYFFYAGLVFNVLLTYDAVLAFHQPGLGWGVTVGTIVLIAERDACCGSTRLSCHACRHLCGGQVSSFKAHPVALPLLEVRHAAQRQAHEPRLGLADLRGPSPTSTCASSPRAFITDYKLF